MGMVELACEQIGSEEGCCTLGPNRKVFGTRHARAIIPPTSHFAKLSSTPLIHARTAYNSSLRYISRLPWGLPIAALTHMQRLPRHPTRRAPILRGLARIHSALTHCINHESTDRGSQ